MPFIEFRNVLKIYKMGEVSVNALNEAKFQIDEGELVVIVGPSGAGKTTALNILGGMDSATSGSVYVDGKDLTKLSRKELIKYRRYDIGFVFQFYNLIGNLTALENVELSREVSHSPMSSKDVLESVGLGSKLDNFPSQLSGGEQQRVAIARAIVKKPKLLLADEPTGALDYNTSKEVLKILKNICKENNITLIIITHNNALTPMADRVIKFKNGTVEDVIINKTPKSIDELEW